MNFDGPGSLRVNPEGQKLSYAAYTSFAIGGSGRAFDLLGLMNTGSGASLNVVKLSRLELSLSYYSGVAPPPGPVAVLLARRSSLNNSGMAGLFTAATPGILDPRDATATALAVTYSSGFSGWTFGILDGTFLRSAIINITPNQVSGYANGGTTDKLVWRFPEAGEKNPAMNKSGYMFGLELILDPGGDKGAGAKLSGTAAAVGVTWTEESP